MLLFEIFKRCLLCSIFVRRWWNGEVFICTSAEVCRGPNVSRLRPLFVERRVEYCNCKASLRIQETKDETSCRVMHSAWAVPVTPGAVTAVNSKLYFEVPVLSSRDECGDQKKSESHQLHPIEKSNQANRAVPTKNEWMHDHDKDFHARFEIVFVYHFVIGILACMACLSSSISRPHWILAVADASTTTTTCINSPVRQATHTQMDNMCIYEWNGTCRIDIDPS